MVFFLGIEELLNSLSLVVAACIKCANKTVEQRLSLLMPVLILKRSLFGNFFFFLLNFDHLKNFFFFYSSKHGCLLGSNFQYRNTDSKLC